MITEVKYNENIENIFRTKYIGKYFKLISGSQDKNIVKCIDLNIIFDPGFKLNHLIILLLDEEKNKTFWVDEDTIKEFYSEVEK